MEFVSEANWRAMMSQPQYDEEDHPILMDQSTIKDNDYRETLQREEHAEKEQFQSKVISLFDQVQGTLEKGLEEATKITHDIVRNALKEMTKATTTLIHETTQTDSVASIESDAGRRKRHLTENGEKDDDEAEKIKENAEYMEEIEEMETGDEWHLPSHNNEENAKREEAIYDICEEIEHVEREIDDCEATINELDVLTICRSRDFQKAVIRNELESGMHCAFCNKIGDHYSDSCATHPSVKDRPYIVRQESRCHMCL
ncbi:hypothetical protein GCK32_009023 [Trichostrongylus colubriformis]|uniref:Uncharacterized protein n=1 Tax=Trichostrongylus colubriformis TaxID=6319 RepID=A0AAN8IHI3_TRICO